MNRPAHKVELNVVAFERTGRKRIEKEGYDARMRGETRSARPYGEDDHRMALAWNTGWANADAEIDMQASS